MIASALMELCLTLEEYRWGRVDIRFASKSVGIARIRDGSVSWPLIFAVNWPSVTSRKYFLCNAAGAYHEG